MNTPLTQPLYEQMSADEQTSLIGKICEFVNTTLPALRCAGRSLNAQQIGQFREGLTLLSSFPQYRMFAIRSYNITSGYDQHISTLAHQYNLLKAQIADKLAVRTPEGNLVVVLQQTQSLRRGRPTQQESEQRKREEQAAERASVVAALTGATISTTDAAPVEERESDTSRRKKDDEPDLFSMAVSDEVEQEHAENTETLTSVSDVSASGVSTITSNPSLKEWMHILPDALASQVRSLRDWRAEMASESERAKIILEQGGSISDMQPHTQRAKELNMQITDLYAAVDAQLAQTYVMLTEVNKDWGKLAHKHMKQTCEPIEKLCARLKPYAKKLSAADGWFDATLAKCRKMEDDRIAAETRDPEKEKLMHKMDAYIRRADLKPSEKRVAKMREYAAQLKDMGADADSLAAYEVFIADVEKHIEQ